MTLYLIGIGLSTEKDISIKGLEIVKKCDKIYLENYTSLLQCTIDDLEKFYGKKITLADRELAEQGIDHIVEEAKEKDVAFLVIGDPFSATTHIQFVKEAFYHSVPIKIINNASVSTAVGITGLQLYKFGKVTSIPFPEDHPNLETPYNVLNENQSLGLHTLFLLDLNPDKHKFMTVNHALTILENIEAQKKEKLLSEKTLVLGCARLGSDDALIKSGTITEIKKCDFGAAPHCLIIPGKLHFSEEEMVNLWKTKTLSNN